MDEIAGNLSIIEVGDEIAGHISGSAEEIARGFEGVDVSCEEIGIDAADSSAQADGGGFRDRRIH